MRDAIYPRKRKRERKRSPGILDSRISSSNAWWSKISVEAWHKSWARLSDLGWEGDWTKEENLSYSEKAMSNLFLLKCTFHNHAIHRVLLEFNSMGNAPYSCKSRIAYFDSINISLFLGRFFFLEETPKTHKGLLLSRFHQNMNDVRDWMIQIRKVEFSFSRTK